MDIFLYLFRHNNVQRSGINDSLNFIKNIIPRSEFFTGTIKIIRNCNISGEINLIDYKWPIHKEIRMNLVRYFILGVTIGLTACSTPENSHEFPVLSGPYLGQPLPGTEPQLFAPHIVSTGLFERDVAMTPDGNEFYFGVAVGNYGYVTILYSKLQNGRWSAPEVVPYLNDPEIMNLEPCISPDGQKFFFLSNRPDIARGDSVKGDQDIWVMDRVEDGWGMPYNPGPPVNTEDEEYFPSVTRDGTIYFTRNAKGSRLSYIYRSRLVDGVYQPAEKLGPEINSGPAQYNAFIDPDERFIIVPTPDRPDSFGGTDYYISFRKSDDSWIGPFNLGARVNTPGRAEYSPYISPDGKYFFFMSVRLPDIPEKTAKNITYRDLQQIHNNPQNGSSDIYWVDAAFIYAMRDSVLKEK